MNDSNIIRVVIIDDHLVVRRGIASLLADNPRIEVVAEGTAGNHVLELLQTYQPDVLITDLQMPAFDDGPSDISFEPVATLRKATLEYPDVAILVLSQEHNVQTIQSLAEVGVKGYILKSDDFTAVLDKAVEMVHIGGAYFSPEVTAIIFTAPRLNGKDLLTERQLDVINAIFRWPEATRDQLAQQLFISEKHFAETYQRHFRCHEGAKHGIMSDQSDANETG